MIFVLKMLFIFVYDRKNENHWSLLVIRYSFLITRNTNTQDQLLIYHQPYSLFGDVIQLTGEAKQQRQLTCR